MGSKKSVGLGILDVLEIVFIVLKLVGVIDWSWVWVLAPIWASLVLVVIVSIVLAVIDS